MIIKKYVIPFLALAGLTFAIYAGTANYPIVFDDIRLVQYNKGLDKPSSLADNFFVLGAAFEKKTGAGFYRPVLYDSYTLDALSGGLKPSSFRVTNILIHLLNAFLVYALFLSFFGEDTKARISGFIAAAFFCLHPVQTESVVFLTARSATLLTFFCLLSLLLYDRFRKTSRPLYLVFSVTTFLLAVLTKESAVPFALVFFLYEYSGKETGEGRRKYIHALPFIVLAGVFSIFRFWYLSSTSGLEKPLGYAAHWLTEVAVIPRYLLLLALPSRLSIDHGIKDVQSLSDPYLLAGVPAVALFVAAAAVALKRKPVYALLMLWPALVMLPEMVIPLNDAMVDYRMYLPMAAISILGGVLFYKVFERYNLKYALAPAACILLLLGAASYQRSRVWADPVILWEDAVKKAPDFARAYINLGMSLGERGDFVQAKRSLERALELDPRSEEAYISLGNVYAGLKDEAKAVRMQETAIRLNRQSSLAYQNLAMIYLNFGDYKGAFNTFKRMAEALPDKHLIIESGAQYLLEYGQEGLAAKLLQE